MSEQNSSGFPFEAVPDGGFDVASIFGSLSNAGADGDVNPFEAALAQQATAAAPIPQEQPQPAVELPENQQDAAAAPATGSATEPDPGVDPLTAAVMEQIVQPTAEQTVPPAPQQTVVPPAAPVFQAVQPVQPPAVQEPNPAPVAAAPQPALDIDPLTSAMAEQEVKTAAKAAKSLFEKDPVFALGSTKEDITDPGMTFEELRIAKADDFPELAEGKRVSWTVEYGKVIKNITDPKGTIIRSVKEEIERSKSFLDGLKKAKDKNPDCLVKPRITAQSKGIASYKGVFESLDEARESDKTICLFPASDGRVYELRKTELGEFVAPKNNVTDFAVVRAGFTPALPLVPMELTAQIVSFFRSCMTGPEEFEALAHILWDRQEEKFVVRVPKQTVGHAHIDTDLTEDEFPAERYLHYIDIHSHNSMAAKFSLVDDRDEQATRIYIVMGRLDKFFPDVTVRMSCGGTYVELDPGCVLESFGAVFPQDWRYNVKLMRRHPVLVLRPMAEKPVTGFWEGGQ